MSTSIKKTILLAFCLVLIWTVTPASSYADDWDKATKITAHEAFEIPGMVLPAGTYVVRIVDMAGDHHVVGFLSEDETTVYATLIAIPDFRLETTEDSVFTFYEAQPGSPKALHSWFYPRHQNGVEFAYPKFRAVEIAAFTGEPVAAIKEPAEPVFREKASAAPEVKNLLEEPVIAVEPNGEEAVVPPVEAAPEATAEPEPAATLLPALPKTASAAPLFAFVGLFAACILLSLVMVRR